MKIMFLLVGASMLVALGFLMAFLWANRSGQFDEGETPAMRILFDPEDITDSSKTNSTPKGQ